MGLKKLAAKLVEYQDRVDAGKARKIEPEHVRKVLDKLRRKEARLADDLAGASDKDVREDLERELNIARQHIARAEWLLQEVA